MALSAYALCSVGSVKRILGITATTWDALFETLIVAAGDWIETFCDRKFYNRKYTNQLYDGNGEYDFWPDQYPITSIDELSISGDVITASTSYADSGYFLYNRPRNAPSRIHYSGGFTKGNQNIDMTYYAGYTLIPHELAQACRDMVVQAWKTRDKPGGIKSESIGNYSYTLEDAQNAGVMPILLQYKKKWGL